MPTQASWEPDPDLVREIEDQFRRAVDSYSAQPKLIAEHANHEESIRTGGYANRTLLELIQNAADALSGAGGEDHGDSGGRVELVLDLDSRTLYCANAGRPFSKSGITAITMAYLSGKHGDEIGRFGLGFKSVLAISETPQVFSRSVSFEFNSAAARAELEQLGSGSKKFPILRTATLADAVREFDEDPVLAELSEWATTVVRLPGATNLDRLQAEIREFSSEFLLFVSAVREIRLRVLGDEPFQTSHVSRDLGDGVLRIERPDGDGDEWIVEDSMHAPSSAARKEVGEAVSRAQIKVTVAVPTRQARQKIGEFWSYFPLEDRTTASALFNAPWSVNDDRTTLLKNDYNREILRTLSTMFVNLLPRMITSDFAAHLDYMPARGREILGFGDELLTANVPRIAAGRALIPDADGVLRTSNTLRPLDFTQSFGPDVHRNWTESPNTGRDVPHWRCYASQTRLTRLRDLFIAGRADGANDGPRDVQRILANMPKRGLLTWLREWAEGGDPISAAPAFRLVVTHPQLDGINRAKVIPTSAGIRALIDRNAVFLHQQTDIEIDGAVFVNPLFLAEAGIEEQLRRAGFRALDAEAILNARLAGLPTVPSAEDLTKLWNAALDLRTEVAVRAMSAHPTKVQVPTTDGGWAWPVQVLDVGEQLGPEFASRTLDHTRCVPAVAHRLGVVRHPVKDFAIEDELSFDEYRAWILHRLNSDRGPGERTIKTIELDPAGGPGPVSLLLMLRDAAASPQVRESWTAGLLQHPDPSWTCEDVDTGRTYAVTSPVRWAVERAGLLRSDRGFRPPASVVAPSMLRYKGLLPLFAGDQQTALALGLPQTLDTVPPSIYEEMLESNLLPQSVRHDVLVEFILAASRTAYPDVSPLHIPARVGHTIEARPPNFVYLATTDEQEKFLSDRQRPYLRVSPEESGELVEIVGCRRFEDSFAFSMLIEGQQDPERVIDAFPGLRNMSVAERVHDATVSRALLVVKRVTTEDGVEDQSLEWHLDGFNLITKSDAEEGELLRFINDAFALRLDNAELTRVRQQGVDHRLELQRQEAKMASSDAERLDVYFGPDDLRDALPKGLWQALEAQGLVDNGTSVSDLFLTVYGPDSIIVLADRFREEGFPDVPAAWAGMPTAISWLRKMGFGPDFAGRRNERQDHEFIVPGAVRLNPLHDFQKRISSQMRDVLTRQSDSGRSLKAMVELPTGAGKTRVASETVLRLFIEGLLRGPVLWIAQSKELCEQAVQTWSLVWRGLGDERALTIGRLWESNTVHQPDTEFSVIVATDAKLDTVLHSAEYEWLSNATAVIVDEGHRAGNSEMYTRILNWLGIAGRGFERPLVGLSATPFKTSETATKALVGRFGNLRIKAFEASAYTELADLGVLARVRHEVLPGVDVALAPDEMHEARSQRRVSRSVLDRIGRDQDRMSILVAHIMEQDKDWPILVFTPDVLAAQVLAAILRYRKVSAESVSGQTGRQTRRDVIERFREGEIQVLANCDLLIQGFDAPGVRALYIARPTFSPSAYIQMAGRGLRGPKNGGKDECLIVDMADNFGEINDFLGYHEYEELWREQHT